MIPRHRTAISRKTRSRPLRFAINDGILVPGMTVLDYGCGRGSDVAGLRQDGFSCSGWDPQYAPDISAESADVVNLGYVVNVIESDAERRDALTRAWSLASRVLIVTARLKFEELGQALQPFADGYLTTRGTFQKFYDHLSYVSGSSRRSKPIRSQRHRACSTCFATTRRGSGFSPTGKGGRRPRCARHQQNGCSMSTAHCSMPSCRSSARAGDCRALRNAPPQPSCIRLYSRIDTILRAIKRAVGEQAFDEIVFERRQDLLVYLALARFAKRARLRKLPEDLQLDIRSFFQSYDAACAEADKLLFAVGRRADLEAAFSQATVGKLTGSALYVHLSAISRLPTLLRLYEGCTRGYVGNVEGATIAKLHRLKPQVSYLAYPRFDEDPHPALAGSFVVNLQRLSIRYIDYEASTDPPILHRKELFVAPTYPRRELFARLTAHEEQTRVAFRQLRSARGTRGRTCYARAA